MMTFIKNPISLEGKGIVYRKKNESESSETRAEKRDQPKRSVSRDHYEEGASMGESLKNLFFRE